MTRIRRAVVLLRTFAREAEKVPGTVTKVIEVTKQLLEMKGDGWMVQAVMAGIPLDRRYKDSDCGELAAALDKAYSRREFLIAPIPIGEVFVGVQNFAVNLWYDFGGNGDLNVDYLINAAPSAIQAGYLDLDTMQAMMDAFAAGAKVVPIAVPEDGIDEFVARGTAGGPIIGWDLKALADVHGFDPAAAQPMIGEENPNAGCEEIHPIVRLIQRHGPCYAPIAPRNIAAKKRVLEGEELKRHQKQIRTKTDRQMAHARSLGLDKYDPDGNWFESFFAAGIMPEFRLVAAGK